MRCKRIAGSARCEFNSHQPHHKLMEKDISRIFEFMNGDKFDMVLNGFELNPDDGRMFLEVCEDCRITVISDPPGRSWREEPPHEIAEIAKAVARAIRKNFFAH